MVSAGPATPGWPGPSSPCLSILSLPRWVSRLITAKTKYTLAHQAVPDKEEGNGANLGWEMGTLQGVPMGQQCLVPQPQHGTAGSLAHDLGECERGPG